MAKYTIYVVSEGADRKQYLIESDKSVDQISLNMADDIMKGRKMLAFKTEKGTLLLPVALLEVSVITISPFVEAGEAK